MVFFIGNREGKGEGGREGDRERQRPTQRERRYGEKETLVFPQVTPQVGVGGMAG